MENKISILMSTYNEPVEWIEESINSILEQTYTNFEFIIICDNPKNSELVDYLYEKSLMDSRIILSINEQNIGLADSLNKAFSLSNGEFIARMDADDISYTNRFFEQINYLLSNNDVDFISSDVNVIDEDNSIIDKAEGSFYSNEGLLKILPYANVLIHPTFLFRRSVFERVGGYRSFPTAEDYDFVLRLLTSQVCMVKTSDVFLKYRIRKNSMSLGSALSSQICSNYIKSLYKERLENNVDSFNLSYLNKKLDVAEKDKVYTI